MTHSERYALDAAKEIVISKMSSSEIRVSKETGEMLPSFTKPFTEKSQNSQSLWTANLWITPQEHVQPLQELPSLRRLPHLENTL